MIWETEENEMPKGCILIAEHTDEGQICFRTYGEAERYTRISQKRIMACIRTGWMWKGWIFRLEDE